MVQGSCEPQTLEHSIFGFFGDFVKQNPQKTPSILQKWGFYHSLLAQKLADALHGHVYLIKVVDERPV
jgi:hypothetical protein